MNACTMTQKERNNLDVFTYNQPQEIFYDYGYVFKNSIKNKEIPQYDPEKDYWSLAYFYEWFGLSGGGAGTNPAGDKDGSGDVLDDLE
jgi:hypothetical protein